jgi:hypothetical protein
MCAGDLGRMRGETGGDNAVDFMRARIVKLCNCAICSFRLLTIDDSKTSSQ